MAPCLLLVVAHLDEADEALDELEAIGIDVAKLPAMEVVPGETSVNLELLGERLTLLRRLEEGDVPRVLVASIQSLMQAAPPSDLLGRMPDDVVVLAQYHMRTVLLGPARGNDDCGLAVNNGLPDLRPGHFLEENGVGRHVGR